MFFYFHQILLFISFILSSISFPIYNLTRNQSNDPVYFQWLTSCSEFFSLDDCYKIEKFRTELNKNEPQKHYNFTSTGYEIIPLSIPIRPDIKSYYYENYYLNYDEKWDFNFKESFYYNFWSNPTKLIPITDDFIFNTLITKIQPIVEKWINNPVTLTLHPTLRLHTKGSIISPHVEVSPKIITVMYQIDFNDDDEEEEDIYKRWSLELIDHHGNLHDITLSKGDLFIFESHSVIFGRTIRSISPSCLILTIHFLPIYYEKYQSTLSSSTSSSSSLSSLNKFPIKQQQVKYLKTHSFHTHSPSILSSSSSNILSCSKSSQLSPNHLHHAVANRNLDHIDTILKRHDSHKYVNERDENGWQPIHEAIRTGDIEICKFLIESGSDIDKCTNNGGTPLWWAKQFHPADHELVCYLKNIGAPERVEFHDDNNYSMEEEESAEAKKFRYSL